MNTCRVTVTVEALNLHKVFTFTAESESDARRLAMIELLMPNGKRSDVRLRGAHVERTVEKVD